MANPKCWSADERVSLGVVFSNWRKLDKKELRNEFYRIKKTGFQTIYYSEDSDDFSTSRDENFTPTDRLHEIAMMTEIELKPLPKSYLSDQNHTDCVFDSPSFSPSMVSAIRQIIDSRADDSACITENSGGFYRSCTSIPRSMSPGRATRLILCLLASGVKSAGLFRWNPLRETPISDEYNLLDLLGRLNPHANTAGAFSLALQKFGSELFHSTAAKRVQILLPCKTHPKMNQRPDRLETNLVGDNRFNSPDVAGVVGALMSRNLAWEFVTEAQICQAGGSLAPTLYLPSETTLSPQILTALLRYVREGGRVVAEMPVALQDESGAFLATGKGSLFEMLFGASVANLHLETETPVNELGLPAGLPLAELVATSGEVRRHLSNGFPGGIENRVSEGSACLLAYPLSRRLKESDDWRYRTRLLACLDVPSKPHYHPEWQCLECLAFRRESEGADHYFLLNDENFDSSATLHFSKTYTNALDAVTGKSLDLERRALKVAVPARSGIWVRLDKTSESCPISSATQEDSCDYDELAEALVSRLESQQDACNYENPAEDDVHVGLLVEDDYAEDHGEDEAEFVYRGDFSDWPEL